jgi:hypothetical protein
MEDVEAPAAADGTSETVKDDSEDAVMADTPAEDPNPNADTDTDAGTETKVDGPQVKKELPEIKAEDLFADMDSDDDDPYPSSRPADNAVSSSPGRASSQCVPDKAAPFTMQLY